MSSLNDKAKAIEILPVKRGPKRRHGWPKRRQNTVGTKIGSKIKIKLVGKLFSLK